jgi:hypothetical protein
VPCHTSHSVQHILLKNQIPSFPQPLYSPDLAPCDLWLFSKNQDAAQGHNMSAGKFNRMQQQVSQPYYKRT